MTNKRNPLIPRLVLSLLLCAQLPLAARADQAPALQPETASLDAQQPKQPKATDAQTTTTTTATTTTTMLNGSVHKNESSTAADINNPSQNPPQNSQTTDSSAKLQAETGSKDAAPPYALALQKLAAREKLSADDYRSLGIGVIGYETSRTYFQNEAIVTDVFPGCPAAQAGMRVSDRQIVAHVDDSKVVDPTRPVWMFSCGIAGQAVDVTVKRHHQLLNFHLVRMNMEDVPDPKLRRTYEQLVQRLGSQPGSIEIPDPDSTGSTETPKRVSTESIEIPKPVSAGSILHGLLKVVLPIP